MLAADFIRLKKFLFLLTLLRVLWILLCFYMNCQMLLCINWYDYVSLFVFLWTANLVDYIGWFLHIELVLHSSDKPHLVMVHANFWSYNSKCLIRDQLEENTQTCVWASMLEISWLFGLLTTVLASADLFLSHLETNHASLANILYLHPLLSTYI